MIESNIGKIIFKNFENETFDENKTVENAKLKVKKLLKSLDETIDRWKSLVQNFNNANNFSTLIPYLEVNMHAILINLV